MFTLLPCVLYTLLLVQVKLPLYKNSNLQHAGNLQNKAKFSNHFVHLYEMLPYPLLETRRKYQECHVLESGICRNF